MKPGDKVMLIQHRRHVEITPVTIKAVTPTGRISLVERNDRFNKNGIEIGEVSFRTRDHLEPWDEERWQKHLIDKGLRRDAMNLYRLGELFQS